MFIIREARSEDTPQLQKLARLVHSFNLPQDRVALEAKVERSRLSFAGKAKDARTREFIFVLEDPESRSVVGTSALYSCISWPGHPHLYFKVRRREHYSRDLGTGQVHVTIQLGADESGPSEIGGLILAPGYRGHPQKLGSLLSYVRFQFMGLHRRWFANRVLAEMMGALTPDSHSSLWDYLGRRFINLSYTEADAFCQRSKEFILNLFPPVEIYISLLPPEARQLVGKVGDETLPAVKMLERLGFAAEDHVDPFDGGPYLAASRDSIPIVTHTGSRKLEGTLKGRSGVARGIVCSHGSEGFRAVRSEYALSGAAIRLPERTSELLGAATGDAIGVSAFDGKGTACPLGIVRAARGSAKSRSAR